MENENSKKQILNKVKKRCLMLSPTVKAGLEQECNKSDFYREGDKAIGKGGFGEVWKVIHKVSNKLYAIKVIDKKNIIEQKMVDQMNREIEIMYKVNHPHVVKLINHFEDDEKFYLIMLYASRGQVYHLMKRQTRFDQRTAAQFMREVLEAVKYLHSFDPPIIHRDIKPENLLLDEAGRIKLADFGWSNFKNEQSRVTYCGTPEYLSPEMVRKQGHDTSVDIWSLGVLLFEFLAGHAPFSGSSQDELFQNIKKLKINWPNDFPPLAKNLVTKILKLNPKERITIDEILSHSWFEKNPPLKPVLTNITTDPKAILESHLINISPEKVVDQIMDIIGISSNGVHNGEYNHSKVNPQLKMSITKSRMNTHQSQPEFKQIIDRLQLDNDKLSKENQEIKTKYERLEAEVRNIKNENIKLKDQKNSENLQAEVQRLNEELEKYKIMNRDRLDLLTEIEEKNNQLFDYENKIKNTETEYQNLQRTHNQLNNKFKQHMKLFEANEAKIVDLKSRVNELIKEKESISINYQKKLEILQTKMLDNTDDTGDSNSFVKVVEMLNDSINEMTFLFKSKCSNLMDTLNELREEQTKSEKELMEDIREKSENIMDIMNKLKHGLEDDLTKVKIKLSKEVPVKNSEMIEWLKKQIAELQPFKNKVMFLDNKTAQYESQIKQLQNRLDMSNVKVENQEKLIVLKENKLQEQLLYSENLEAKLSDVKDFVFKNCQDNLDAFNNCFKNYYTK